MLDAAATATEPLMTPAQADRAASIVLAVAAVGAAVVILRVPALRRQVWKVVAAGVTTGLPGWITREVQQAWSDTSRSGV